MPPNPKSPSRPLKEEQVLNADDPRPQRIAQYPSSPTGTRRAVRKAEEAIPTALYDTEADQEMQAQYGVSDEFKPAFLYVERGPGLGQLLEVKQGTVVVGRASVSDLRLQHPSISRRHAQVKRVGEQFFLKDLGSQNGTFINKERINGEVEVKPGDSIALGNALVRLRGPLTKEERTDRISRKPVGEKKVEKTNTMARMQTAVVSRPTGSNGALSGHALKIAVLAGVVGFGVAAVLAFVLVRAFSGPSAPTVAQGTLGTGPTRSTPDSEKLIDEALRRKMAEGRRAAEPRVAVVDTAPNSPSPVAKQDREPVVRTAPVVPPPRAAATPRRAVAPSATAENESEGDSPVTKRSKTQLLAAYEKGNAEGSLEAAKRAGDKDLAAKLSGFIQAYDAANDAMLANSGTAAILNFQRALSFDEQLSSGWGRYGGEIRKKLANLYVLVGLQHASNGDDESAKRSYQAAIKHDPANERARNQLEKLGVAPTKTVDESFDEAPTEPPTKTRKVVEPSKKEPAAASIDDAFGD